MMHQCLESCGWISGIIAALSFGSFGVPIKSISNLNVDPLVMQTYKSVVCFLTCWFVIFLGEPIRFTPWGIISGIFWVPGATAGIYGIRNAGLAISTGTWSAINVITSFSWGIFVFKESVKSVPGACYAALVLIIGLVGMSTYSEPPSKKDKLLKESEIPLLTAENLKPDVIECSSHENQVEACDVILTPTSVTKRRINVESQSINKIDIEIDDTKVIRQDIDTVLISDKDTSKDPMAKDMASGSNYELLKDDVVCCYGIFISRRNLGIIGAVINGAWGGNSVIPMHYAKAQGFDGAGYLVSFSCGSMIVTVAMWILRYLVNLYRAKGDTKQAYDSLPPSHFKEMWLQGFLAGSLYSLGNFCTLITVSILGQGVGYSFVQTSMLISGLWGIFYFNEIHGASIILKWLLSSFITIIGILCLSYEHITLIPEE